MVRALLRGERRASWGEMLGLFAMVALLVASLLLNYVQRRDFIGLKHTIVARCTHRQSYDEANHNVIQADLDEQISLRQLFQAAPTPDPTLLAILTAKIAKDRAALAQGVLGNCKVYN